VAVSNNPIGRWVLDRMVARTALYIQANVELHGRCVSCCETTKAPAQHPGPSCVSGSARLDAQAGKSSRWRAGCPSDSQVRRYGSRRTTKVVSTFGWAAATLREWWGAR